MNSRVIFWKFHRENMEKKAKPRVWKSTILSIVITMVYGQLKFERRKVSPWKPEVFLLDVICDDKIIVIFCFLLYSISIRFTYCCWWKAHIPFHWQLHTNMYQWCDIVQMRDAIIIKVASCRRYINSIIS